MLSQSHISLVNIFQDSKLTMVFVLWPAESCLHNYISPDSFKQKTSSEEKRQAASVHLLWFPAHLFLLILHFGQLMCLVYNVLFLI